MDTCASCLFYGPLDPKDEERGGGQCRRYPPKIIAAPSRSSGSLTGFAWRSTPTRFPVVRSDNWCGEFMSKTKPLMPDLSKR